MKLLLTLLFAATSTMCMQAQSNNARSKNATTTLGKISKLPKGACYKNGKLTINSGYKTQYSKNGQIVFLSNSSGGITGAFSCKTREGWPCEKVPCLVNINGGTISCSHCCELNVSLGATGTYSTLELANANSDKIIWKQLSLPTKVFDLKNKE